MSRARARATAAGDLAWTDRLIEAGVLFLLVFTPLAYGTVEPWSEAIAEGVVLVMATVWLLDMVWREVQVRVLLPPGWVPAALFLALILLQTVRLPAGLVAFESPWAASHYQAAAAFAGTTLSTLPLSLGPHATWREALKLLAIAGFFLVLYNTYRARPQVIRALWTMILTGAFISLFGIVQRVTWNGRFYWLGAEAPGANAFGPFVNRAHFAGLMVIVVPVALALILGGQRPAARRDPARTWRERLRRWNSREAGPTRLVPLFLLLMGGAALVAGSRGGVVALLAGLLVMIGLGAQGATGRGRAARVAIAAGLIILAGMWIGGDILYATVERLAEEVGQPKESGRVQLWADALRLWRWAPILGTGFATFEVAYPHVRTVRAPVAFTHAESDWVQLLTDTGALGLLLALAAALTMGLALLRRYRGAESHRARAFALGGAVALVGTVVQGIGNFNLPVMSNWLYLAATLAIAPDHDAMMRARREQPPPAARPTGTN